MKNLVDEMSMLAESSGRYFCATQCFYAVNSSIAHFMACEAALLQCRSRVIASLGSGNVQT